MPSFTFYAQPNDGYQYGQETTYAAAREGTGIINPGGLVNEINVGQAFFSPNYTTHQAFLCFDTSGIPDSSTIVSAKLELAAAADNSVTDFVIEARAHDWGPTLEGADYVAGSALGGKTLLATLDTTGGLALTGYLTFASDAAFAANINKTGTTCMILASNRQRLGTAPTGNEWAQFHATETSGAASDPKLTVVTVPALSHTLGTNNTKTTGTTLAITTTNAVAAGESVAVALAMDPAAGTVSCADSAGNTYTVQDQVTNGSGTSGIRLVVLAAHNAGAMAAGGTITVTHPSCAARAVSAASFLLDGAGQKVASGTASGSSTAPSVTVASPNRMPLVLAAVAVEGALSDTYTEDADYVALPSAGSDAGGAASNATIRWAWRGGVDELEHTHTPTFGASRAWAQALIVLDTSTSLIRTFTEKPGMRSSDLPGTNVVEAGVTYDPSTGFASKLNCSVHDPALTVFYRVVIGGTDYGGSMSYGENTVTLPASTMGVVIDAAANVDYTGIDGGSIDLRIPG